MAKYRRSRMLATAVVVLGALCATIGVLLVVVAATMPFFQAASVPFFAVVTTGVALSLFGCIAHAFFDIAETIVDGSTQ